MPQSEFNLATVLRQFGLSVQERTRAFAPLPPVLISELLGTLLREQVPLAVAINAEKACSEFIVVNFLAEGRWQ